MSFDFSRYAVAPDLSDASVKQALQNALATIDRCLPAFTDAFPDAASVDLIYPAVKNTGGWTTGFWTGMLWLAYEYTGNTKYREVAERQVKTFTRRIEEALEVETHDLGFLYTLSCVAAYRLTGNAEAKRSALLAADHLLGRYKVRGEFIQAWGVSTDPSEYRLIIDGYLNLPLLFWASEVTGDPRYAEAARNHAVTAMLTVVRNDGSTYHTYYFDPLTGQALRGETSQGKSDDSCWSRGQAWGIYGLTLSHLYTGDTVFLDVNHKIIAYYLDHVSKDYVPDWDFSDDRYKDSSAASIAVCGLMETVKNLPAGDRRKTLYDHAAKHMLKSLIDAYTTDDAPHSNGLLKHAVYDLPAGLGVNECNIWGDYYYMEALVRMVKPSWRLYW